MLQNARNLENEAIFPEKNEEWTGSPSTVSRHMWGTEEHEKFNGQERKKSMKYQPFRAISMNENGSFMNWLWYAQWLHNVISYMHTNNSKPVFPRTRIFRSESRTYQVLITSKTRGLKKKPINFIAFPR